MLEAFPIVLFIALFCLFLVELFDGREGSVIILVVCLIGLSYAAGVNWGKP